MQNLQAVFTKAAFLDFIATQIEEGEVVVVTTNVQRLEMFKRGLHLTHQVDAEVLGTTDARELGANVKTPVLLIGAPDLFLSEKWWDALQQEGGGTQFGFSATAPEPDWNALGQQFKEGMQKDLQQFEDPKAGDFQKDAERLKQPQAERGNLAWTDGPGSKVEFQPDPQGSVNVIHQPQVDPLSAAGIALNNIGQPPADASQNAVIHHGTGTSSTEQQLRDQQPI